ncbi:MAG: hypothetical protein JWP59_3374 [Massilia sp.]|nr:hypothetical protein [Massilia sp.]
MQREAIAWSASATTGAIALADGLLSGDLENGLLDCRLNPAGKFRNGAARWWCVPHQCYWGVKADLMRGDGRCRAAAAPLRVALDPPLLEVGAVASLTLHQGALRVQGDGLDLVVPALALAAAGLFDNPAITRLNVTPPALAALAHADGCVDCARCGHPHLDLGAFATRAHRRHTCGHCGHDSTHSSAAMVSNPLYILRGRIAFAWRPV